MMSYKLQRNVYLIFHNRHFLKNTRRTQLAHHASASSILRKSPARHNQRGGLKDV